MGPNRRDWEERGNGRIARAIHTCIDSYMAAAGVLYRCARGAYMVSEDIDPRVRQGATGLLYTLSLSPLHRSPSGIYISPNTSPVHIHTSGLGNSGIS